jgi:hypothetical protein
MTSGNASAPRSMRGSTCWHVIASCSQGSIGRSRIRTDPNADISIFAKKTKRLRDDSLRLFAEAVAPSPAVGALDANARRVLELSLWSLHMGVLLYFVHDRSKGQQKTRRLVDQSLDLVCALLPIAPELAPVFGGQVAAILRDAELI